MRIKQKIFNTLSIIIAVILILISVLTFAIHTEMTPVIAKVNPDNSLSIGIWQQQESLQENDIILYTDKDNIIQSGTIAINRPSLGELEIKNESSQFTIMYQQFKAKVIMTIPEIATAYTFATHSDIGLSYLIMILIIAILLIAHVKVKTKRG